MAKERREKEEGGGRKGKDVTSAGGKEGNLMNSCK